MTTSSETSHRRSGTHRAGLGLERPVTADQVEQELAAGLGEGQIAEFVEHDEVEAGEVAVTAADLSGWRDAFLEAGAAGLKSRARDDRDETIDRLRTKVGELGTSIYRF
jgi:hypothetical protein